ncbi:MAG: hypothetical protein AAFP97_07255 [Pseudomonadota bacterium]
MSQTSPTYSLQIQPPRKANLDCASFEMRAKEWFEGFQRFLPLGSAKASLYLRSRCALTATLDLITGNLATPSDAVADLT